MTKLDWRRAAVCTPDPGAVVEVFDTGGVFCGNDTRPFVPKSKKLAAAAARAKTKRKKVAKSKQNKIVNEKKNDLIFPAEKIRFIMSIMRDIGAPMPLRIKSLEKSIRSLMSNGVIDCNGDFILSHPLVQKWADKMIGNNSVK